MKKAPYQRRKATARSQRLARRICAHIAPGSMSRRRTTNHSTAMAMPKEMSVCGLSTRRRSVAWTSVVVGSFGLLATEPDAGVSAGGKMPGAAPSVVAVGVGVSIPSRCVADAR
jgi:hypothetical protein